jgi:DNA repair and recombination protein RAD52
MFSTEQIAALAAKLDKSNVATRQQAGRSLSYIEGWHAIAEANRIFGFDGWNREAVEMRQLGEPREVNGNIRVGYSCRVRITVRAGDTVIIREGCGFGSGIDRDVDQAHESALKEAETDAMKRALMTFGNPFGLALYDKQQANVETAPPPRPAPVEPAKPTLRERANALESAMRAKVGDPEAVQKAYDRGAGLCADLDKSDPERLAELNALLKMLLVVDNANAIAQAAE